MLALEKHHQFMREAIRLSYENISHGGGPFAAVIVKDDRVVAQGVNSVTRDNDPTAHAEINAIRKACAALESFDLSGCVIYSSCEPCPMCLSAIYWAHIEAIYYGNTRYGAAAIHFDDAFLYDELARPQYDRTIKATRMLGEEAWEAFIRWMKCSDKKEY
ncbi:MULTISPECIES: nucleoside deaminase [unclassified Carboxylicivirga]|uniref:nucleoside deaminase n=1 Tax=Carboxylicivirga TaxID=1628153 RepID=UPI003D33C0B4